MTNGLVTESGSEKTSEPALQPDLSKSRILIVDDHAQHIRLVEDVLGACGLDNRRSTTNPREALAIRDEYQPDLIILDMQMPDLDGVEVMRQLGSLAAPNPYLPVLVVTSDGTLEAKERAFAAGAADFLTKPIQPAELVLRVKALLRTRWMFGQIQRQSDAFQARSLSAPSEVEPVAAQPATHDSKARPWIGSFLGPVAELFARGSGTRVVQIEQYKKELDAAVEERTRELEQVKEGAEAANLVKSQFLANMCREIRTPMNGVLGTLELALATELTREQKNYIEMSRGSAESLLALLDDILDFSTVEVEELEIAHTEFSLRHCVRGALSVMSARPDQKGITLQEDIAANVPDRLMGDPDRLRKVLLKIIETAVKASSVGKVAVGVRLETPEESASGSLNRSVSVLFSVHDNGPGFSKNQRDSVFETLQEANTPLSRKYGGAGVGLGVCGRLVRLMDGRIWLDNEVGQGNRFYFTARFDMAKSGAAKAAPPAARPQHRESVAGARILVAEDNRVNQIVMVRLLEKRGAQALVANNGKEALDIHTSAPVDLILMDIQMPEMDGREATRRIREHEKSTGLHVPIMALTAHAMKGDREKCIRAGMDGYLAKPIQGDRLYQAIEELLLGA